MSPLQLKALYNLMADRVKDLEELGGTADVLCLSWDLWVDMGRPTTCLGRPVWPRKGKTWCNPRSYAWYPACVLEARGDGVA